MWYLFDWKDFYSWNRRQISSRKWIRNLSLRRAWRLTAWSVKNTENSNSKIFKTKNGRLTMQAKCADSRFKKSRFVKEQKAKGLLSSLGLKHD